MPSSWWAAHLVCVATSVAHLRCASVYRSFDALEDVESAVTSLRAERAERAAAQA